MALPVVTVGVPVRNGAATIESVLRDLSAQTYPAIQIVVSDNASEDGTSEAVRRAAEDDPRIQYSRLDHPVPAMANWRAVLEAADTPYFLWAADDDYRSRDYVATLVDTLESDPTAGLAFGTIEHFREGTNPQDGSPYPYVWDTRGTSLTRRLWADKNGPYSTYGLFRTHLLEGYRWYHHSVSPDWPLFFFLMARTEMVQVAGAVLYYRVRENALDATQRAGEQSLTEPETWLTARLAWRCALAFRDGAAARGVRRHPAVDAPVIFAAILRENRQHLLRWALEGRWR